MVTWSGLVLVLVTTAIGWVALWPSRRSLDALSYHLYAFPVGLIAWTAAGATTTLFSLDFRGMQVAVGVVVFIACVGGVQWLGRSKPTGEAPAWRTFLVAAGALTALCIVVILAGYTIGNWDSIEHYEGAGIWLYDTGNLSPRIMGNWSPLIPSMHAANRLMGGDFNYVPYPVVAAHVLVLLALVLYRFGLASLPKVPRALLTAGAVLLLVTRPPFAYHALYVHSHMISAAYLLAALVALRHASENGDDRASWVTLSALSVVGLALTRPDGLAYAFVPITIAGLVALESGWTLNERVRYAVLLWVPAALPYAACWYRFGFWGSPNLPADGAAAVFGVMLFALLVLAFLPALKRVATLFSDRSLSISVLTALLALTPLVLEFKAGSLTATLRNMAGNLAYYGGYENLWYAIAGAVLVALAFPKLRRASDFSDLLGLALIEFFAIALVVHTAGHHGRLAAADSFNRVVFHTVPLFDWYVFAFVGTALHAVLSARAPRGDASPSLDTAERAP